MVLLYLFKYLFSRHWYDIFISNLINEFVSLVKAWIKLFIKVISFDYKLLVFLVRMQNTVLVLSERCIKPLREMSCHNIK